jgi:DNA-binding response OmpR family regulator
MGIGAVQKNVWSFVLDEPTRVLVADDDPILREFAIVHLSSPTATIETAGDGATALSMLTSGKFDVALLDIEMPALDGFSLLETIRAEPELRHMPVMMLTGHEDIASIDRAYSLGANSFVTKPVNWRLLSYHVRYVLRTSRVEHELRQSRRQAEANEASYNRTLLAFEVECRDMLRSILRHAASDKGSLPQPEWAETAVRRIEALAAATLRQWDELANEPAPAATAALSPDNARAS